MAQFKRHTIKETGKKIFVSYKTSWGKTYYSFDGEETWTDNFNKGYQKAKKEDKLVFDNSMRIVMIEDKEKFYYNRISKNWNKDDSKATNYNILLPNSSIDINRDFDILKEKNPGRDIRIEV